METIHHPLCGVLPPHMLDNVAGHGDDDLKATAASTLQQTALIAEQRHAAVRPAPAGVTLGQKKISVYNAGHRLIVPGKLMLNARRTVTRDRAAREAFNNANMIWDFYRRVFDRDSIDGRGMPVLSTVHYGRDFDNAMWNGQQMIYGDGDGVYFTRFTAAIDVCCHEMTHGVTQHSAMLDYKGQPGALNEHVSDVFGMMFKQYVLNQRAEDSNWIIGEGLFTDRVHGKGIRSMKAPGTAYDDPVLGRDPQPAHMRDYVLTSEDNGGVHINSGIPNRAFYLASTKIGGPTWPGTGQVWYQVVKAKLSPRSSFIDMARETTAMAGVLFGRGGRVQRAIADAWAEVGLPVHVTTQARLPVRGAAPKWRGRPLSAITTQPQK